jgi:glycosyltransferase involved in cell wall biosynthesis
VPHIYALITGLGAAFHTTGFKGRLLRFVAVRLYRLALARCTKILVQNKEISDLFIGEGIVPAAKVVVVAGSGVDTEHFVAVPIPSGPPVFVLLARMLRDKGIEEYVAAARLVKKQMPDARFLLVGNPDANPSAIRLDRLNQWSKEGVIEYRPSVADVRPLLVQSTVYVLPSYHEGMPRSVLEAMSVGRPIITTDAIGCRDLVFDLGAQDADRIKWGRNGALVPVREVTSLAVAMLRIARNPKLAEDMGQQSRLIAERFFDVALVNAQLLAELDIANENRK